MFFSFRNKLLPVQNSQYEPLNIELILTKADNILMIPISEVIINHFSMRSWTHLLHLDSDGIYVGPTMFRGLSICLANTWCEIEGKCSLASCNVGRQVEFGNKEDNCFPFRVDLNMMKICPHW